MRKLLPRIVALGLLLCPFISFAQYTDSFYLKMAHIFEHVETGRIQTGLLKDYGIDFADVSHFNGVEISDTNIVSTNTWIDLYTSVFTYRFNNNISMQHPDTIERAITDASANFNPLSLILYKYHAYRDNAVAAGLVTVMGDQVYDRYVNGVWQDPYEQRNLVAMSCNKDIFFTGAHTFRLPSSFIYSNYGNIQTIEGDFADGMGWRPITANTDIGVNYADTGKKVIQFRVSLTTNQQFICRTAIQVAPGNNTSNARFFEHLDIPIAATAQHSGGTLQVHFSTSNIFSRTITKPLIIAEGFDPWKFTNPKNIGANTDFDDFWSPRWTYGGQLADLLTDDYDIIYLDYNDGTDYVERNAALLTAAINEINARKAAAGSSEQNVVLGISMGGLVARYALRQMELNGLNHQTRLFLSLDAPYLGANVPLGLQALNTHMSGATLKISAIGGPVYYITTVGAFAKPLRVYETPAARQLLAYYVITNPNGSLSMYNAAHDQLYLTLKNMGYPVNTRNVAVANGSECAVSLPMTPGNDLLRLSGHYNTTYLGSLLFMGLGPVMASIMNFPQFFLGILPGRNDLKCNFRVRTTPASGTTEVYNGKVWYEKKILWLIPAKVTLTAKAYTSPAGVLPLDVYPGGQYPVNEVGGQVLTTFDGDFGTAFFENLTDALVRRGVDEYYLSSASFTFTPTPHVLDIGQGNVALAASDYTIPYKATVPPASPRNTPFVNFLTAFEDSRGRNELHVEIESRSGNWIAAELNTAPATLDCSAMCNIQIAGPSIFCTSQSYSLALTGGTTVNWSVTPSGLATISASGTTVTLNRIANGTVTLSAFVTGACNNFTLQRSVIIGAQTPEYTTAYLDVVLGRIKAWISPVPGATSYKWYVNGVLKTTTTVTDVTIATRRNDCGSTYTLAVEAVTPCGTSQQAYRHFEAPPCGALVINRR